MFSRAGLARLYMRGDLLSQAIQEWDAVLSTTPDRLDARTGQLETYWRAGQLEYVDQLAEQILHDVPGCLKALLLQASIIFPKDSQRAQKLLQRAQTLDPDFVQAQELFADALAKQPDDPFLRQLNKAPALLNSTGLEEQKTAIPVQRIEQQPEIFAPALDTAFGNTNIAAALAQWGGDASWNSDTTLVKPPSDASSSLSQNGSKPSWVIEEIQDSSPLSRTSPTSNGTPPLPTWNASIPELETSQASQSTSSEGHAPEPWELLQNALNQFSTNGTTNSYEENLPLWDNFSGSTELSQAGLDTSSATSSWSMSNQQEHNNLPGIETDVWSASTGDATSPQKKDDPVAPSWLNMLDQTDRSSLGNNLSSFTFESQSGNETPFANPLLGQLEQPQPEPLSAEDLHLASSVFQSTSAENAESQPSLAAINTEKPVEDIDEESFFGPAWLKSLGATTLADEETPATEVATQHTEQQAYTPSQSNENLMQAQSTEYGEKQQNYFAQPPSEPTSVANPYELWLQEGLNQSSSASMKLPEEQNTQPNIAQEHAEQNLVTTLEALEQSLRSKGFIPLEPNSLATVASQTQEGSASSLAPDALQEQEENNTHDFQQANVAQEARTSQAEIGDSSLSSTLAQLGSITNQPDPSPAVPPLSSFEDIGQTEEPSWLQALKNSATPPTVPATPILPNTSIEPAAYADTAVPSPEQSQQYQQLQEIFSHFQSTPTSASQPGVQELDTHDLPHTPSVRVEPIEASAKDVAQVPAPVTKPVAKELQETVKVSALNRNPLLDGGLETTMKRPAVRLQPMQRQTLPSQAPVAGGAHIVSRTQSGARIEKAAHKVAKTTNENLSYHDRLLKGYQHQLVGDYDEAMQEYRIIIRNATELLSEVVSNVRALLKLAPNYAAGYRVLGDAYMRQGEYLQAMEAYNKALSITKKAK